jgi:hypothetical protein
MLSHNFNNINGLLKSYALACAYMLDNTNDIDLVFNILEFLFKNSYDKPEVDIPTKSIIMHLYGIIIRSNPKTKGEGLALIEESKKMKKRIYNIEKVSLIRLSDFKLDSDYDKQTLDYISRSRGNN